MSELAQFCFVYDRDCGFCMATASGIARHARDSIRTVAWQNIDQNILATGGITRADCERRSYLIDLINGSSEGGATGILHALAIAVPSTKWLTIMLRRVPGISHVTALVYVAVAKHRGLLSRILGMRSCELQPRASQRSSSPEK